MKKTLTFLLFGTVAAFGQDLGQTNSSDTLIPQTAIGNSSSPDLSSTDARHQRKVEKFKNHLPRPMVDTSADATQSTDHPIIVSGKVTLPLPLNSSAIIIAKIDTADAHVTEGKTGVYSEFKVRVLEVLRQDATQPTQVGDLVVVDRFGGAVRFPSGRVERYWYANEGFPVLDGTYVLFLARPVEETDYYLYTGYRLDGSKVRAVRLRRTIQAILWS